VCTREEHNRKLNIDTETQLGHLEQIALERQDGSLTASDLEALIGMRGSQFVEGPHALLVKQRDETFEFRHSVFEAVLYARCLSRYWEGRDGDGLKDFLRRRLGTAEIDPLAGEYLASLVSSRQLAEAWEIASRAPYKYEALLRRNLLGLALAKVDLVYEQAASGDARPFKTQADITSFRSQTLAQVIPDHDVSECDLEGIVFNQLDLRRWDFRRVRAEGAAFMYCDLRGASFDESLRQAQDEGSRWD
jgi:uncharacterized protein YjbI with pentapeptide repeats